MLNKCALKCILSGAVLLSALLSSYAQPRTIGATFSFTGLSVAYEHSLEDRDAFLEFAIKSEQAEYYVRRSGHPGISASFTLNSILKQWKSSEGNTINLYAGPGLITGYCADYKTDIGPFFGLKGRVGVECCFERNATISISSSPILGAHLLSNLEGFTMKYYKNGLIYSLVPEIGIRYRF